MEANKQTETKPSAGQMLSDWFHGWNVTLPVRQQPHSRKAYGFLAPLSDCNSEMKKERSIVF